MKYFALIALAVLLTACSKTEPQSASATPVPPMPSVVVVPAPSGPTIAPRGMVSPSVDVTPAAAPTPTPADVVSVRFTEINERGYPMVQIRNLTDRDIDDISGSFRLTDASGSILHATGLTIGTPGVLFVAAGEEVESSPFGLNTKTDLMTRLKTEPETMFFRFEVIEVTYMDSGTE